MYKIIDINLIYIKFLQYLGNLFKEYKQFFFLNISKGEKMRLVLKYSQFIFESITI